MFALRRRHPKARSSRSRADWIVIGDEIREATLPSRRACEVNRLNSPERPGIKVAASSAIWITRTDAGAVERPFVMRWYW